MSLQNRDKKVNWHPFSTMEDEDILPVVRAEGNYLYLENGERLIDMVSSWWVNLHGHNHPYLMHALREQTKELDHVIFAGFTHPKAVELSEKLLDFVTGDYQKVFYSDDGSTANEVAIKMALQFHVLNGKERKKVIAFQNAYHGDTFGVMSLAGKNLFNEKFSGWLIDEVIQIPVPINGYSNREWDNISALFTEEVAAFIYEPILQGAAGMIMYDAPSLDKLISLAKEKNIITIADEVLTGFGRTGKWFASDYLLNKADLVCLSKGITGGILPLGVTLVNEKIANVFRGKENDKYFYHGHSYTANALSCAVACANLDLLNDDCLNRINSISLSHSKFKNSIPNSNLQWIRNLGTVLAANVESSNSYLSDKRNIIYKYFIKKGLLVRPLGNVIYCIPPYSISEEELNYFYEMLIDLKFN